MKQLDLSHNNFKDLRSLAPFRNLELLVLDNNQIGAHVKLPLLPKLHTLWVNHNKIANLSVFIEHLASSVPQLKHLAMMNNEAAPSFFNGGTKQQYVDFRYNHCVPCRFAAGADLPQAIRDQHNTRPRAVG